MAKRELGTMALKKMGMEQNEKSKTRYHMLACNVQKATDERQNAKTGDNSRH